MSGQLSAEERCRLLELLPAQWRDIDYQLSPLPSESNDNFLLSCVGKRSLVLRVAKADAQSLGVNRQLEQGLYSWASSIDLSPALLWADKDQGVMLSEYYVDAKNDHDTDRFVDSLAQQLAKLHSTSLEKLPFDVNTRCTLAHISTYKHLLAQQVSDKALELAPDIHKAFDIARRYWSEMSVGSCLCHSDLHRDNILFHEGKVFFLDWEYTAITPAVLDIASLLQSYDWSGEQLERFYSHYQSNLIPSAHFNPGSLSELLHALAVATFLLAMQSFYWAMLHYGEGPNAEEYREALKRECEALLAFHRNS